MPDRLQVVIDGDGKMIGYQLENFDSNCIYNKTHDCGVAVDVLMG